MRKLVVLVALFALGVFAAAYESAEGGPVARCTTVVSTIGTITETVISTVTETVTATTATTATTGTTTTTPPPATGTIAPGQSWQAAYDAAAPDATLRVLAGNHGSPTVTGTKHVTFLGDEGAIVSKMPGDCPCTFDNIDVDTGSTHGQFNGAEPRVPGITFRNVNITGDTPAIHVWATDFTWDGGGIHDRAMRRCALNDTGVPIWLNADRATIRNLDIGAELIDDTVCIHGENIRVENDDDVTITGNYFHGGGDEGSGHVFITCSPSCVASRISVEGNVFEPVNGTYAIQIHQNVSQYDSWTIRNNRFDQPVLDYPRYTNLVACGNTGQVDASWQTPC